LCYLYFLIFRRHLSRPLFPYTTLFRSRKSREPLGKNSVELVLLALYAEGVVGQGPDQPEIELNSPAREIPVLQLPRDQSHLDQSDRKSTRLNSSHVSISYAVFCLKKKK